MSPITYAKGTTVSVSKSQAEILAMLKENGADDVGLVERQAASSVLLTFQIKGQRFQVTVPTPKASAFRSTPRRRSGGSSRSAEDNRVQAEREVWRLIGLAMKAKFGLIREGISTAEQEFLGSIILPGGGTVGEAVARELQTFREGGRFGGALLLGMGERAPDGPGDQR